MADIFCVGIYITKVVSNHRLKYKLFYYTLQYCQIGYLDNNILSTEKRRRKKWKTYNK